jgi:hypothetical protein
MPDLVRVDRVFWRNITDGDYWHSEKILPEGARGQLRSDCHRAAR